MKRIERPPHVLYVERDRMGSLLCLWIFLLLLPVAWRAREVAMVNLLLISAALLTGIFAFVLLFRERVIAVDRSMGELRLLERRLPGKPWRRQVPLEEVRLVLRRRPSPASDWELLVIAGGPYGFLIRRSLKEEPLRRLGEQLAADTGRPLETA